jgi:hypothetical protein
MENVPGSTGTSSNQVATVTRQQIASNHMDRISLSTDRMGRSGVERISRHRTLQMIELIVYCFIFFPLIT